MARALDDGRILVTGASGVIGTALAAELGNRHGRLRLLARRPWSPVGDAEVVTGDVRDPGVLSSALTGIDTVIHLAGQTNRHVADADPVADWQANVAPLAHILEAGRREDKARTVLLVGSETQAGVPARLPLNEQAPDCPVTVYDLHKQASEQLLQLYVRRSLAHGACIRLPTVFGSGPPSRGADRGAVARMVREAVSGQPLTIYGSGNWRRDFLYLADVVTAFLAALDHPAAVDGRHFVIGVGEGVTMNDLAHRVSREVARQTGCVEVPVQRQRVPEGWSAIDERDVVIDATAFREATGWSPSYDLTSGLAEVVTAFVDEAHSRC